MENLKVGDKVRVGKIAVGTFNGLDAIEGMVEKAGEIITIKSILPESRWYGSIQEYLIEEDDCHWNESMFEFNHIKSHRFGGYLGDGLYITRVMYNNPATIVFWSDGTKTVSKCSKEDTYSKELGLTLCVLKKTFGSESALKLVSDWANTDSNIVTLRDVRKKNGNK